MASKPNIIIITTHDTGRHFGCYGIETVHSPAIDALAADGYQFTNYFTTSPVCSPSRSAIITGCYQIRNGTHVQRSSRFPGEEIYLPEGHKTVPELFRDAGYFTYNRGKDDYNFTRDREKLYSTGNAENDNLGKMKGVQAGGGDPLEIELRGFHLSLRRAEAGQIELRAPGSVAPVLHPRRRVPTPPSASRPHPEATQRGAWRIALAGNPNTGKTTLFNALTGARAGVSNQPGTTIDVSRGTLRLPDRQGNFSLCLSKTGQ